jgi:hypothetical protein
VCSGLPWLGLADSASSIAALQFCKVAVAMVALAPTGSEVLTVRLPVLD